MTSPQQPCSRESPGLQGETMVLDPGQPQAQQQQPIQVGPQGQEHRYRPERPITVAFAPPAPRQPASFLDASASGGPTTMTKSRAARIVEFLKVVTPNQTATQGRYATEFEELGVIGAGGFGSVTKCRLRNILADRTSELLFGPHSRPGSGSPMSCSSTGTIGSKAAIGGWPPPSSRQEVLQQHQQPDLLFAIKKVKLPSVHTVSRLKEQAAATGASGRRIGGGPVGSVTSQEEEVVLREASSLASLHHEHIVRYFSAWIEQEEVMMPRAGHGEVSATTGNHGSRMDRQHAGVGGTGPVRISPVSRVKVQHQNRRRLKSPGAGLLVVPDSRTPKGQHRTSKASSGVDRTDGAAMAYGSTGDSLGAITVERKGRQDRKDDNEPDRQEESDADAQENSEATVLTAKKCRGQPRLIPSLPAMPLLSLESGNSTERRRFPTLLPRATTPFFFYSTSLRPAATPGTFAIKGGTGGIQEKPGRPATYAPGTATARVVSGGISSLNSLQRSTESTGSPKLVPSSSGGGNTTRAAGGELDAYLKRELLDALGGADRHLSSSSSSSSEEDGGNGYDVAVANHHHHRHCHGKKRCGRCRRHRRSSVLNSSLPSSEEAEEFSDSSNVFWRGVGPSAAEDCSSSAASGLGEPPSNETPSKSSSPARDSASSPRGPTTRSALSTSFRSNSASGSPSNLKPSICGRFIRRRHRARIRASQYERHRHHQGQHHHGNCRSRSHSSLTASGGGEPVSAAVVHSSSASSLSHDVSFRRDGGDGDGGGDGTNTDLLTVAAESGPNHHTHSSTAQRQLFRATLAADKSQGLLEHYATGLGTVNVGSSVKQIGGIDDQTPRVGAVGMLQRTAAVDINFQSSKGHVGVETGPVVGEESNSNCGQFFPPTVPISPPALTEPPVITSDESAYQSSSTQQITEKGNGDGTVESSATSRVEFRHGDESQIPVQAVVKDSSSGTTEAALRDRDDEWEDQSSRSSLNRAGRERASTGTPKDDRGGDAAAPGKYLARFRTGRSASGEGFGLGTRLPGSRRAGFVAVAVADQRHMVLGGLGRRPRTPPPPNRAILRRLYIAMEFVEGVTLRYAISQKYFVKNRRLAWDMFRQICDGLSFVHSHNFVHRDIKPENVFLKILPPPPTAFGSGGIAVPGKDYCPYLAKIGDFGLATLVAGGTRHGSMGGVNGTLPHLPPTDQPGGGGGSLSVGVGTQFYIAPEAQAAGGKYDQAADLFALGVVLFELMTPPVRTHMERHIRLSKLISTEGKAAASLGVNDPVAQNLIESLLAKDPNKRPSVTKLMLGIPRFGGVDGEQSHEVIEAVAANPFTYEMMRLLTALFNRTETESRSQKFWGDYALPLSVSARITTEIKSFLHSLFRSFNALQIDLPRLLPAEIVTAMRPTGIGTVDSTTTGSGGQSGSNHLASCGCGSEAYTLLTPSGMPLVLPTCLLRNMKETLPAVQVAAVIRRFAVETVESIQPRKGNSQQGGGTLHDKDKEVPVKYPHSSLRVVYDVVANLGRLDAMDKSVDQNMTDRASRSSLFHTEPMRVLWIVVQAFRYWIDGGALVFSFGRILQLLLVAALRIPTNVAGSVAKFIRSADYSREGLIRKLKELLSAELSLGNVSLRDFEGFAITITSWMGTRDISDIVEDLRPIISQSSADEATIADLNTYLLRLQYISNALNASLGDAGAKCVRFSLVVDFDDTLFDSTDQFVFYYSVPRPSSGGGGGGPSSSCPAVSGNCVSSLDSIVRLSPGKRVLAVGGHLSGRTLVGGHRSYPCSWAVEVDAQAIVDAIVADVTTHNPAQAKKWKATWRKYLLEAGRRSGSGTVRPQQLGIDILADPQDSNTEVERPSPPLGKRAGGKRSQRKNSRADQANTFLQRRQGGGGCDGASGVGDGQRNPRSPPEVVAASSTSAAVGGGGGGGHANPSGMVALAGGHAAGSHGNLAAAPSPGQHKQGGGRNRGGPGGVDSGMFAASSPVGGGLTIGQIGGSGDGGTEGSPPFLLLPPSTPPDAVDWLQNISNLITHGAGATSTEVAKATTSWRVPIETAFAPPLLRRFNPINPTDNSTAANAEKPPVMVQIVFQSYDFTTGAYALRSQLCGLRITNSVYSQPIPDLVKAKKKFKQGRVFDWMIYVSTKSKHGGDGGDHQGDNGRGLAVSRLARADAIAANYRYRVCPAMLITKRANFNDDLATRADKWFDDLESVVAHLLHFYIDLLGAASPSVGHLFAAYVTVAHSSSTASRNQLMRRRGTVTSLHDAGGSGGGGGGGGIGSGGRHHSHLTGDTVQGSNEVEGR